jgi:predicted ester cyclase
MSIEQNKALVRRIIDELNMGNLNIMDEVSASNVVFHFPGSPPLDRAGFKGLMGMFLSAFPDLETTIEDLIAEGDMVVRRGFFRGTQRGEFQGIPPTGKQVTVPMIAIERIVDGKLVEHRASPDIMGLMQQLGAIPAPGQ